MALSNTIPISCNTTPISFLTKSSSRPSNFLLSPKAPKRDGKISCAAASKDDRQNPAENASPGNIDRRNVLLGLGGLYGAYQFADSSINPFAAVASPVPAPDISKCGPATISFSDELVPYSCCPPFSDTIIDYELPTFSTLNVRRPAHDIGEAQLEKYKLAVQRMKDLPEDDPRNFYQQAKVHCAYCNGAYQLAGKPYQVHFDWLFFPFHRWYLYFHERILQSLIDDPTFTLPFWNWDEFRGMYFPAIFDDRKSPLYNEARHQSHRDDVIMDLGYSASAKTDATFEQIVVNNMAIMYRQMVTNAPCPLLFFGQPLRAEDNNTTMRGMGTIESVPHNSVHQWVGSPIACHGEDMGNFYSAARDPIFYCHHSNVDRMWTIWKTLGGNRKDIDDPDYLQTEFLFYDENANLVKVKVADCLDNEKLGYTFQNTNALWKNAKPQRRRKAKLKSLSSFPGADELLPATLDNIITFYVTRPTPEDGGDKVEMLNFSLEYDDTKYIRFDVFLNEDNDVNGNELDRIEYAGSFANLAHVHEGSDDRPVRSTTWSLAISELIEDMGLNDQEKVLVTLLPKNNGHEMKVNAANVTLTDCN